MKGFLIAFVIAFTVGVLTSCSKDDDNCTPTKTVVYLNGTAYHTVTQADNVYPWDIRAGDTLKGIYKLDSDGNKLPYIVDNVVDGYKCN